MNLILRGTRANQPAADSVVAGTVYCVTDEEFITEISTGTIWRLFPTGPIAAPFGGEQGIQGIQGIQGDIGPQGLQGIPGIQGEIGPQGNIGNTGLQGEDIQGPQGIPGNDGLIGPEGPEGPIGLQGETGLTGDIGPQGLVGPQGIQGIDGEIGLTGLQGPDGNDGLQGNIGLQGIQGIPGEIGPQGITGDTGIQGLIGPQGIPGIDGLQGIQGIDGPSGAAPVYTVLANGAVAMAFGVNSAVKVTPTASATFTTTVPAAGNSRYLIILTTGVTSRTITFGTGFKPTATLATGTVSARVFIFHFISDGTNLYEVSRTIAMAA